MLRTKTAKSTHEAISVHAHLIDSIYRFKVHMERSTGVPIDDIGRLAPHDTAHILHFLQTSKAARRQQAAFSFFCMGSMSVALLLETRLTCEYTFVSQIRLQLRYPFTLWIAHFNVDDLIPFDFFSTSNALRFFSKHPHHLGSSLFIPFLRLGPLKVPIKKQRTSLLKDFTVFYLMI